MLMNRRQVVGLRANIFLSFEHISCQGITSFKYIFLFFLYIRNTDSGRAVVVLKLQLFAEFYLKIVPEDQYW